MASYQEGFEQAGFITTPRKLGWRGSELWHNLDGNMTGFRYRPTLESRAGLRSSQPR